MKEIAGRSMASAASEVRQRIGEACARYGRSVDSVTLIAVTKTVPVARVAEARAAGVDHFGENYAKDLVAKASAVGGTWHFIGTLQSGTARLVADHADVIHSAEPGGAVDRLARRARSNDRTIPCLVEVDFTTGRHGVRPEDLPAFLDHVEGLPGIELIGLMTVPPQTDQAEQARPYFRRLRQMLEAHREAHPTLRELSMGMSADFEIAVEEGATMVRVGTALFGDRPNADAEPEAPGTAPGDAT
ncbi:MAG TPA: YggS family pyridoxal phosphate-dependent enzyme [Actinomycetota bacterium]|nr:YggS family pyridoxal phosphate-dependent enzyme [Actinomycetota bacterium]